MIDRQLRDRSRRELMSKRKEMTQVHRYKPETCTGCHGKGWSMGAVRNTFGTSFPRPRECTICKGRGFTEDWEPPTVTFFCTNEVCPDRFMIDIAVKDIIKGMRGLVRTRRLDHLNYTKDRECPYCHYRLSALHNHRFVKFDPVRNDWIDYWQPYKPRPIKITRK